MNTRHIHCKLNRTPEEAARLREDRDRYQRERPTPQQLLAEGGHKDFVKLGELLTLHQTLGWLKQERERQNLTLAEISKRTGIDQAALSRLETGKNSNPTHDTLNRVAAALGKTIRWSFQDAEQTPQSPATADVDAQRSPPKKITTLVLSAPRATAARGKKSFERTFNSGVGEDYAIAKDDAARLQAELQAGNTVVVVVLSKDETQRAEGTLVKLVPNGRTRTGMQRYDVYIKDLNKVEYKPERLGRTGVSVI
jgi:transcriptional regulator with XRE-family HTH domain